MTQVSTLERVLWVCSVGGLAILILRLLFTRLYRVYRFFSGLVAAELAQGLVMLPLDPNEDAYAWVWLVSQPLLWAFYILVVLELYSLVFKEHAGISSIGRWAVMGALLVSTALSAASLYPDLSNPTEQYRVLLYYTVIERGIVSSLLCFILLLTLFLTYFPVRISRNNLVHAVVFSVYFLASTLALLVRNVTGQDMTRAASTALLAISTSCLAAWILLLRRGEAEEKVYARGRWDPDLEDRLIRQLKALNSTLLRTSRK